MLNVEALVPALDQHIVTDLTGRVGEYSHKLGGYSSPKYVASGGSAALYRVESASGVRAIKAFDPALFIASGQTAERRRLDVLKRLIGHDCAALVQTCRVEEALGTAFVEMEFIPWPSLKAQIADVPDDGVPSLFAQSVAAVRFLDTQTIVHRDIKPENIHVSPDFTSLKLFDLGITRESELTNGEEALTDHGHLRPFLATATRLTPELPHRPLVGSRRLLRHWMMIFYAGLLFFFGVGTAAARSHSLALVPPEIASDHFLVTINGQRTLVMHAAVNVYFLNFDAHKHTRITVTAPTDTFWDAGVDVQPWRLGIRPERKGRVLSFTLDGAAKITLSRPNDFLGDAEMLYLFANPPQKAEPTPATPGVRYIGPGVHTENIDAATGDSIYLAPGAVVFGALNVWGASHVRVFGPGVIVYDGPQNPADDDGWMHKRNWHCIVMDNAHDVAISDLTCVVRSRTWQIQMKDSRNIVYDNLKVIGANTGNANADGMDWLGGGDTIVRNSFFRAADDVFAMQSSWDGYGPKAFAVQGSPVTNISVENTLVSTSISNIVRAGWPQKNFEGGNFTMKNSDVLHMGMGGCGVPFALMELWADPAGRGQSSKFSFEDIRLDDWYSLVSLQQPTPVQGVHFTDISALRTPPLVPSVLKGDVTNVTLDNINFAGNRVETAAEVPLDVSDGAAPALISNTGPKARVFHTAGWLRPRQKIHFEATPATDSTGLQYTWLFGDGTIAHGRKVTHRFPDSDGTLHDRSGLFHVLLHITNEANRQTWIADPIVVRDTQNAAFAANSGTPGAVYQVHPLTPSTATSDGGTRGTISTLALTTIPHPAQDYHLDLNAELDVPADGGYVFTVIANDESSITIDDKLLGTGPKPFAQVCGLAGNAARPVIVTAELAKGLHHLNIIETHTSGVDNFQVLWKGPGIPLQAIPAERLSHR